MSGLYNKNNLSKAKQLRHNMTIEEKILWYRYLRNADVKFYRQKPIGNYVVDFYCPKLHLVIELDGSQHYKYSGIEYDTVRTRELNKYKNIKVLRIPNNQIKANLDGVCNYIQSLINEYSDSNLYVGNNR